MEQSNKKYWNAWYIGVVIALLVEIIIFIVLTQRY